MNKPTIFISCGQYSDAEKRLGKLIAEMVKNLTGFEVLFAEDVQDLNGLDAGCPILRAFVSWRVAHPPLRSETPPEVAISSK